jgi:hypothetical protein
MSNAVQTPAAETRCERCHRPLKSASSRILGIGPRCAAIKAATEDLKPEQADKALELIADGGIVPTAHEGVYRVSSSKGDVVYLAAVTGQCSCAYGLRRLSGTAKTCYHVAGARLAARPVIRRTLHRSQFVKAA